MPGDELFKRYLEIGASVLGMSRERAEGIVKDLVASGEVAKGQANKAADWLVERGRTGTEELAALVRREIRQQVTALGLATKDDVARLETQIAGLRAGPAPVPAMEPAIMAASSTRKAVSPRKAAAATARPDSAAASTKPAGISRSGSVAKRSGAPGSAKPAAAPPPGGADPSKG